MLPSWVGGIPVSSERAGRYQRSTFSAVTAAETGPSTRRAEAIAAEDLGEQHIQRAVWCESIRGKETSREDASRRSAHCGGMNVREPCRWRTANFPLSGTLHPFA